MGPDGATGSTRTRFTVTRRQTSVSNVILTPKIKTSGLTVMGDGRIEAEFHFLLIVNEQQAVCDVSAVLFTRTSVCVHWFIVYQLTCLSVYQWPNGSCCSVPCRSTNAPRPRPAGLRSLCPNSSTGPRLPHLHTWSPSPLHASIHASPLILHSGA